MDGRVGLGQGDPNVATYTYNLMASEYGMKVRNGYQEHCIDLVSVEGTGVKTILPFEATGDTADSRLFATTNEGIWDCSTYDIPSLVQAFGTTTGNAGVGTFIQYVTDAGDTLMFYADEENGLFTYDQGTDSWAVTAGITGVDTTKVRVVMVHKLRIWLVEKDSADAWYLGIGAISGAATKFQFGQQFKHGGVMAGLFNWTIDGGIGVDDYLVAVSSAGDVLPYQGSDPESTDDIWENRGVYYVGEVSRVQQCATTVGGDLYILSVFGLVPLAELLNGVAVEDVSRGNSIAAKMAFLLQNDLKTYGINTGWRIDFMPAQGDLIISSPIRANDVYLQYVFDLSNNSFGWWREVPINCFDEWQGILYFGTSDNTVQAMNVDLDQVKITPINEQNGVQINFSALFAFLPYDSAGGFKRGVAVRPDFMSTRKISYESKFTYDYEILNFTNTLSGATVPAGRWDNGLWDNAIWGTSSLTNKATVIGGAGIGRTMAVAINGASTSDNWLMSYDVMWDNGGLL